MHAIVKAPKHICAVVSRLRKGWEAWSLPFLEAPALRTAYQDNEATAQKALEAMLREFALKAGWSEFEVHWFAPAEDFKQGDTAYQYIEDGNTDTHCSFLNYEGTKDGQVLAKVQPLGRHGEAFLIDPKWLKPVALNHPWVSLMPSRYTVPKPAKPSKLLKLSRVDKAIEKMEALLVRTPQDDPDRPVLMLAQETLMQCRVTLREARTRMTTQVEVAKRYAENICELVAPLLDSDETPPTTT